MEMADIVSIKFEGIQEFTQMLNEMKDDISEKDQKKILNNAIKLAMKPVLSKAQSLVPVETGALRASLRIEARKPTNRDKRSLYVSPTDVVIGTVTTAPGNVLAKIKFHNEKNTKSKIKQVGITSDARAVANEFGTAKMAGRPFMRPAMETSTQEVLNSLAESLKTALDKYQAKQAKKG
jgi:HK97 gp10 family phage protein